jgi:glyoxylase-like metal-dependent hydrolase (beta-lactamase superfamily II)
MPILVKGFYEERTSSVQYVVRDMATSTCAVIDPVLDFEEKSGSVTTYSADALLAYIAHSRLGLAWILDTHPHADHMSAAAYLKEKTGVPTAIGRATTEVQEMWKNIYQLPTSFPTDGRQWDRLFADGETFQLGSATVKVIASPGHTLASVTYLMEDTAFIHDTLFMPDVGTARADFPGGSARDLWRSIQRILDLPDETRLFTGHDYPPKGRAPAWESSVARQKAENVHLREAPNETEFVRMREKRDKQLPLPKQMLHALQVNINGGNLPLADREGKQFLKIPLNALPGAAC